MTALPLPPVPPVFPGEIPELITVGCNFCEEGIVLADVGTYYEHWVDCQMCGGSGEVEVCGRCKKTPHVENGVEACDCALYPKPRSTCELCSSPEAADGLCVGHIVEGLAKYREDAPTEVIVEELAWARSRGWL